MKDEVIQMGVRELQTSDDVDTALGPGSGTTLVFVNSNCGCAGGIARPALKIALGHNLKPETLTTVFATTDREATARAREYFDAMPASSPSFALLRDGKLLEMIHRSDIDRFTPQEVASRLTELFDKYCAPAPQKP